MIKIEIPLAPPSVNTYWRKWNNIMVMSKKGREFKESAKDILSKIFDSKEPLDSRLELNITFNFKDRRKRDIDNYCKGVLDSMSGIVFVDDEQIDKLNLTKKIGCGFDRIDIEIKELLGGR